MPLTPHPRVRISAVLTPCRTYLVVEQPILRILHKTVLFNHVREFCRLSWVVDWGSARDLVPNSVGCVSNLFPDITLLQHTSVDPGNCPSWLDT